MADVTHLFVYGTLISAATDAMGVAARARLHREATRVADAVIPGRIYDLGRYPGLVTGGPAGSVVHGEVLRLHQPDMTLDWLDVYESIDPRPGAVNEYVRVESTVTLNDGMRIAAWVYRYILVPDRWPLIASGRWLERQVT